MKYNPADKLVTAGLDLIHGLDPELYEWMHRERWEVTQDIYDGPRKYAQDLAEYRQLREVTSAAFGGTLTDQQPGIPLPHVTINDKYITNWAKGKRVRPVAMAAATLAHEFRHIHQPYDIGWKGEWIASLAAEDFAERLAPEDAQPILDASRSYRLQWRDLATG